MQLAVSLELTAPPAPEAVAKTDKSVSLRLRAVQLDRKLAFQVVRIRSSSEWVTRKHAQA